MDSGLFILRVVIGALLAGHGVQKLYGWFGGPGLDGAGGFFHSLGFRPGRRMAAVAGSTEVIAGLFLALGFLSPLAGAAVIGTMLVAGSVHAGNGLWGAKGGYELPLLYAVVGAVVAVGGPGSISLDNLTGLADRWSEPLGLAAVVLGLVSGAAVIARARRILRREAAGTSSDQPEVATAA